ncbi:MAG: hypothetical protein IKP53_08445 [Candidatus Methanomethylophilaceae archaeon]|jgi:hypothetical protein|nr:hypothetical protein [Candidatus Methanomethylophilaceae archaeon]
MTLIRIWTDDGQRTTLRAEPRWTAIYTLDCLEGETIEGRAVRIMAGHITRIEEVGD